METGKLKVGWTVVRVELVKKRPIQCYKCWAFGHVGFSCTVEVDQKGHCYFCGKVGHTARYYSAEMSDCLLCKEKRLRSDHRLRSARCSVSKNIVSNKPLPRAKPQPRRINAGKTLDRRPADVNMDIDDAIQNTTV